MIVVKKFYAVWCSPCRTLAPIFKEVASLISRKDVKFEEIDVDTSVAEAEHYKVKSVPTIVVIKDGFVVDRVVGLISRDALFNIVNKHIPL